MAKVEKSKNFMRGNVSFYNNARIALYSPSLVYLVLCVLLMAFSSGYLIRLILVNVDSLSTKLVLVIAELLLSLITAFFSIYVGFSNPGYLAPSKISEIEYNTRTPPICTVDNTSYFLQYCCTCQIVKAMRMHHCKHCNLCVERHDHHCPWLAKCIGVQNHKSFLVYCLVILVYCSVEVGQCFAFLIAHYYMQLTKNFGLAEVIATSSIGTIAFVACCLIIGLLAFQLIMIMKEQTTSEYIKSKFLTKNPFDKESSWKNLKKFWENPYGFKQEVSCSIAAMNYLSQNSYICEENSFEPLLCEQDLSI